MFQATRIESFALFSRSSNIFLTMFQRVTIFLFSRLVGFYRLYRS